MPSKARTPDDVKRAAAALGCDVPALLAVIAVESRGRGFDDATGLPLILYEPHVFSRLTDGVWDKSEPLISYPKWGARPYPKSQGERWQQIKRAANLNSNAAWQSASWGLMQIMGFNWQVCGFPTLDAFLAAMHDSEAAHLMAGVGFIKGKGLDAPLRAHDWHAFARGYNGPKYAANKYHTKLADAWARYSAQ